MPAEKGPDQHLLQAVAVAGQVLQLLANSRPPTKLFGQLLTAGEVVHRLHEALDVPQEADSSFDLLVQGLRLPCRWNFGDVHTVVPACRLRDGVRRGDIAEPHRCTEKVGNLDAIDLESLSFLRVTTISGSGDQEADEQPCWHGESQLLGQLVRRHHRDELRGDLLTHLGQEQLVLLWCLRPEGSSAMATVVHGASEEERLRHGVRELISRHLLVGIDQHDLCLEEVREVLLVVVGVAEVHDRPVRLNERSAVDVDALLRRERVELVAVWSVEPQVDFERRNQRVPLGEVLKRDVSLESSQLGSDYIRVPVHGLAFRFGFAWRILPLHYIYK